MQLKNSNKYPVIQIKDLMSLREPQYDSLKILDNILSLIDINQDNKIMESIIHDKYIIFKEFERDFPSITFALATGVGKTKLMGAMMFYLNQNYGIQNFFVLAPNLTIYNKLIKDFGSPNFEKYVFSGLQPYAQILPNIITGENFKEKGMFHSSLGTSININIFNISKINAEVRGGSIPQIKKIWEYLGQSYFDYLTNLPDLVMLMDESHHYRAAAGFKALNDLKPVLGLEFTATPQIETSKGAVKFKNVVYEYSLAKAIGSYVKTPWVATKKNFNPKNMDQLELDKLKLIDGIMIHRNTKVELETYAKNNNLRVIKPFALVVCKDIIHANEIIEFIRSKDFFDGYYNDKVIEIDSAQKGTEKDENIEKLLNVEKENNNIEIVVHVNMLKEGWDVTNLYTIIPLRVAASLTLREQTIGRGLRLPYGQITGDIAVDRLTIVAHDKFEEIINAANDKNSIIMKEHIIDIDDSDDYNKEKRNVESKTLFKTLIDQKSQQYMHAVSNEKKQVLKNEIKLMEAVDQAIDKVTSQPINISIATENKDINVIDNSTAKRINIIPTITDLQNEEIKAKVVEEAKKIIEKDVNSQLAMNFLEKEIEGKINYIFDDVVKTKIKSTIEIPNIAIVSNSIGDIIFHDFDLDTSCFFHKFDVESDKLYLQNLKDPKQTQDLEIEQEELTLNGGEINYIINELLDTNLKLDFGENAELIIKIINQMFEFLKEDRTEQEFIKALVLHKKEIANEISAQFEEHCEVIDQQFAVKVISSSMPILCENYTMFKKDNIKDYTEKVPAYMLKSCIFDSFKKACHNVYKFDSIPELNFAAILESSSEVIKWLHPALNQLPITYGQGERYQPDFIVELQDKIYIIEIKSQKELYDEIVEKKGTAAKKYCENVNKIFGEKMKKWEYCIIPDYEVKSNMDFEALVRKYRDYNYFMW